MALFKQISIIGVGLIGGSLAKSIKKNKLANCVTGYFRNKKKLRKAIKNKTVDKGSSDLTKAVAGSDLIILALPINKILEFLPEIKRAAKENSIVTDVGSIKTKITNLTDYLNCNFVGSHPLAGSEKRGAEFSRADLFKNSLTILTVTPKTRKQSLSKVKRFWHKLDSKTITTTPQHHDSILSLTSHLPHLISFGLINAIPNSFLQFSGSGLRDTTRIAKSDALLWSEIFLNNKTNMLKAISLFETELNGLKKSIRSNKKSSLIKLLILAKNKREKLL